VRTGSPVSAAIQASRAELGLATERAKAFSFSSAVDISGLHNSGGQSIA
jgi:hypothetical protein